MTRLACGSFGQTRDSGIGFLAEGVLALTASSCVSKAPPKRGREQERGNGGRLSFSLHEPIRPIPLFFSGDVVEAQRFGLALVMVWLTQQLWL